MTGVAILGGGVVGYGVAQMLTDNAAAVCRAAGQTVKALYILDIRDMETPPGVKLTKSLDEVLADPDVRVVAETIGGQGAAYAFTKAALSAGRHVVTSNKELVAAKGDELSALAREHRVSYRYEASVGGGIPVLAPIMNCLRQNVISRVDGIVNGSTNYLLTKMRDEGVDFPEALREAKALGYVEADPSADVDGWDAQRKLYILAHCAFGARFDAGAALPVTGIGGLKEDDILAARAFGGAVKLIAHAERIGENAWTGWVRPCFVPQGHPLYAVDDVFNGIIVRGDFVDDVMFYGRGAGRRPTASAVVGDIVAAAREGDFTADGTPLAEPPAFVPGGAALRRLVRCDSEAAEALARALSSCEKRPLGGGWAVMTPPLTDEQLAGRAEGLNISGAIAAIPE